jgi:hypothetical protein
VRSLAAFGEQRLEPERMSRVAGARVVYADYATLRHDFGEHLTAALGENASSDAIDAWLLRSCAFVSMPQARGAYANSPIVLASQTCVAYRPPRYGRAAIFLARARGGGAPPALFDVKGCGVPPDEEPVLPNSNGLLTLGEAVHELTFAHLTSAALRHAGSELTVVPVYAILDLGFDATWHDPNRPDERAVVLVRRAQTRPSWQWAEEDPGAAMARRLMDVELTLRTYGISASTCGAVRFRMREEAGALTVTRDGVTLPFAQDELRRIRAHTGFDGRPLTIDGVNVQVAHRSQDAFAVLDFGRYRFRRRFGSVLYAWSEADYENLRGLFLRPGEPEFVQPNPRLSMAPARGAPRCRSLREMTERYRAGTAGRAELTDALAAFVRDATGALS